MRRARECIALVIIVVVPERTPVAAQAAGRMNVPRMATVLVNLEGGSALAIRKCQRLTGIFPVDVRDA